MQKILNTFLFCITLSLLVAACESRKITSCETCQTKPELNKQFLGYTFQGYQPHDGLSFLYSEKVLSESQLAGVLSMYHMNYNQVKAVAVFKGSQDYVAVWFGTPTTVEFLGKQYRVGLVSAGDVWSLKTHLPKETMEVYMFVGKSSQGTRIDRIPSVSKSRQQLPDPSPHCAYTPCSHKPQYWGDECLPQEHQNGMYTHWACIALPDPEDVCPMLGSGDWLKALGWPSSNNTILYDLKYYLTGKPKGALWVSNYYYVGKHMQLSAALSQEMLPALQLAYVKIPKLLSNSSEVSLTASEAETINAFLFVLKTKVNADPYSITAIDQLSTMVNLSVGKSYSWINAELL